MVPPKSLDLGPPINYTFEWNGERKQLSQDVTNDSDVYSIDHSPVSEDRSPDIEQQSAKQRTGSRTLINLAANAANVAVNILVGIWFTRYLINHLGVSGYGLVPLVSQVVSYFSLLTLALNASVGRYLTIALERRDLGQANRFFNTSLFGSIIGALLLLLPGLLISLKPSLVFEVPQSVMGSARWLVLGTMCAFLINVVASPFEVASFCRNRFDLRTAVAVSSVLTRVGLVVVLFSLMTPNLWQVGAGMLAASLVGAVGAIIVWRRLMPGLSVNAASFDTSTLKRLTSTGGWIVINQVGSILYLNVDLLLVNRLLGPEPGGHYAAVLQWPILLRALAGAVAGVFAPTVLYLYARNDLSGLVTYARRAVRFCGLLIGLVVGLICGLSRPLLHVWLGADFVQFAPLMILMTFHLSINLGVLPLFSIQVATNRVRWPGTVTCIMGIANLSLALILAKPVGWGMYGIAAAGAIMLTAKNAIFTPVYGARIIGVPARTFYTDSLVAFIMALLTAATCWLLSSEFDLRSWLRLAGVGTAVSAVYLLIVCGVLVSKNERTALMRMIQPRTRNGSVSK